MFLIVLKVIFPIEFENKPYSTPRGSKINMSELYEIFIDEIKNNERNISNEVFREYFGCQSPSFLVEDLLKANGAKNKQMVEQTIDSINQLKNSIIKKQILANKNPGKIINIAEKILKFSKQQKGIELKRLTPKKMLQRLPIALSQIKASNNSESLLNEIWQTVCSLCQSKKLPKSIST